MGEMGNVYKIWMGNLKGRDNLEDLDEDGDNIKMYFRDV